MPTKERKKREKDRSYARACKVEVIGKSTIVSITTKILSLANEVKRLIQNKLSQGSGHKPCGHSSEVKEIVL